MEELALGQREVVEGIEFTAEELSLMTTNGVTADEVKEFVRTSGKQTINTAIPGLKMVKAGQGQERNEPFVPTPEAEKTEELPAVE